MALTTTIAITLSTAQDLAAYSGQARDAFPDFSGVWPDGTGQGEADLAYYQGATTSTPVTVDLDSLTDAEGAAVSFAEVRLLAVRIASDAPGAVEFTIPGANGWDTLTPGAGDLILIQPGGLFIPVCCQLDGAYPVVPPDSQFRINPTAGASDYHLLIVGTSA